MSQRRRRQARESARRERFAGTAGQAARAPRSPYGHAGRFGNALSSVRYVSPVCTAGDHPGCRTGRGDYPCSCECHADTTAARLAYRSTKCQIGPHDECPSLLVDDEHPRGQLFAEEPGRPELIPVPCVCECHR